MQCNVPHKPDLRTANYAPEFPPSVITAAAIFTVSTAAIFTVSTATVSTASAAITAAIVYVTAAAASIITVTAYTISIISAASTVFTATTAISISPPLPPIGRHIWSTQLGYGVTIRWHRFCSQLRISGWRQIK
jgi:hypothetical protein